MHNAPIFGVHASERMHIFVCGGDFLRFIRATWNFKFFFSVFLYCWSLICIFFLFGVRLEQTLYIRVRRVQVNAAIRWNSFSDNGDEVNQKFLIREKWLRFCARSSWKMHTHTHTLSLCAQGSEARAWSISISILSLDIYLSNYYAMEIRAAREQFSYRAQSKLVCVRIIIIQSKVSLYTHTYLYIRQTRSTPYTPSSINEYEK